MPQTSASDVFDYFVLFSLFKEGEAYFSRKYHESPSSRKLIFFSYAQRLALYAGDYDRVRLNLAEEFRHLDRKAWPPEIKYLHASVTYNFGRYNGAYEEFTECLEILSEANEHPAEENLRCRIQLMMAKCAWRQEDFFLAQLHCMAALIHYRNARPDGRQNYLLGRILTVYVRSLVQRRNTEYSEDSNLALKLLTRISDVYETERRRLREIDWLHSYPQQNRDASIFDAEVEQLRGKIFRLRTHRDPTSFEEARKCFVAARKILERIFPDKPHRRMAHLERLEGFTWLWEGIEAIRSGRSLSRRVVTGIESSKRLFTKEYSIRRKVFKGKPHGTVVRNYNNQALASLLLSLDPAVESTVELLREAEAACRKAFQANGVTLDEEGGIAEMPASLIAPLLFLSTVELYMQVRTALLRQAGEPVKRRLQEIYRYYEIAGEIEYQIRAGYNSRSAKEDLARRFHPIQECVIAVCEEAFYHWHDRPEHANDLRQLLEYIRLIELASKANPLQDQMFATLSSSGLSSARAKELSGEIESVFRESALLTATIQIDLQELLAAISTRIDSTYSKEEENTSPSFEKIIEGFDAEEDKGAGIVSFFVGHRHIYALIIFARSEPEQPITECIRLLRLTQEEFVDVHRIRTAKQKLWEYLENMADNLWRESRSSESHAVQGDNLSWDMLDTAGELYRDLIEPLGLPRQSRYYFIPDRWLWEIPWPMLCKPFQSNSVLPRFEELDFLVKDFTITLHASLSILYLHCNQFKDTDEEEESVKKYELATIYSRDVNTSNYDKHTVGIMRDYAVIIADALGMMHPFLDNVPGPGHYLSHYGHKSGKAYNPQEVYRVIGDTKYLHLFGHSQNATRRDQKRGFLLEETNSHQVDSVIEQEYLEAIPLHHLKLAIINTCLAGHGKRRTGHLPEAMSTAFLLAKTRNILYTLFQVSDRAAMVFTKHFVEHLFSSEAGDGSTSRRIHEAYRSAQLSMLRGEEELTHPFYWGGHLFIGDQMDTLPLPRPRPS